MSLSDHDEAWEEARKRTLSYQAEELARAFRELGWAIAEALHLPQLVAWLNRKLGG